MSNMSYCRFTNTLEDLKECLEALEMEGIKELEDEELEAFKEMEEVIDQIKNYH